MDCFQIRYLEQPFKYAGMIDFSMDVVAKEHETRLKVAGRARQCSTVSIWVSKYKYKCKTKKTHTGVPNSVGASCICRYSILSAYLHIYLVSHACDVVTVQCAW